jgi:hypothetical protein
MRYKKIVILRIFVDKSMILFHLMKVHSYLSPGGEIGRRTGLKILGFVNTGVPVQVRPGAPSLPKASDIKPFTTS